MTVPLQYRVFLRVKILKLISKLINSLFEKKNEIVNYFIRSSIHHRAVSQEPCLTTKIYINDYYFLYFLVLHTEP